MNRVSRCSEFMNTDNGFHCDFKSSLWGREVIHEATQKQKNCVQNHVDFVASNFLGTLAPKPDYHC